MAELEQDRSQVVQERLETWKAGILLPVILSLGRLAESLPANLTKGNAGIIENYLLQVTNEDPRMAAFAPFLLEVLKTEGALVLFDGLDEVANLELRPRIIEAVDDFVRIYNRNSASRFLVTCRTLSYRQDEKWQLVGWMEHELALFTPGKIDEFVDAWYDELSGAHALAG